MLGKKGVTMRKIIIPPFYQPRPLTPGQLREAAEAITAKPVPYGYPIFRPGIDSPDEGPSRLFMEPPEVMNRLREDALYDRRILRFDMPLKHEATDPQHLNIRARYGQETLFPLAETFQSGDRHGQLGRAAILTYLMAGYEVFDQHDRPLAWDPDSLMQIVGLRTCGTSGEPLGMPTGYGSFIAAGQHPVTKTVLFTGPSNDPAVLLQASGTRGRGGNAVWRVFRGHGNRLDLNRQGYDVHSTAQRSLRFEAGVDVAREGLKVISERLLLTRRTTIHATLFLTAFWAYIQVDEEVQPYIYRPTHVHTGESRWLKVGSLLRFEDEGRGVIVHPADRRLIEAARGQAVVE